MQPIVLTFSDSDSMLDVTSLTIGIGGTWGTAFLPFAPLDFSEEAMRRAGFHDYYMAGHSNEEIYNAYYSVTYLENQALLRGHTYVRQPSVRGFSCGIGEAGILSAAGDAIGGVFTSIANTICRRILTSMGGDIANGIVGNAAGATSSISQSTDCLIHGMNGHDTYNMNMNLFRQVSFNFVLIQGVMGALFELSMSLVFFGNFRGFTILDPSSLWTVYNHAVGFAFVPNACLGLILPGVELKFIYSCD